MLSDETFDRIFVPRAISREVAEARPYVRYAQGKRWEVLAADPLYRTLTAAEKWFIGEMVDQQPGLVMVRHPFPGADPQIFAELRPDEDVIVKKKHTHPRGKLPAKSTWRKHLRKPHGSSNNGLLFLDKHPHEHPTKYIFPPNMKKGPKAPRAARFDVHPRAKLESSPRGWLILEGCLKADSMLTAAEPAVCSVPSVTQWRNPDLRLVEEWAVEKDEVFAVSDSDWFTNPTVARQSISARDALRDAGANAHHVSPPPLPGVRKTGVDDFLHRGHAPDDLLIVELEVPSYDELWIPGRRVDVRHRNRRIAEYVITHAAPYNGIFEGTERSIGRALGIDNKAVAQGLEQMKEAIKLVERGFVQKEGLDWKATQSKWWIIDVSLRPIPRTTRISAGRSQSPS